jgi:hypothetical protein
LYTIIIIIDNYSLKFVGQIYEESSVSIMEQWEPWAKPQLYPNLKAELFAHPVTAYNFHLWRLASITGRYVFLAV